MKLAMYHGEFEKVCGTCLWCSELVYVQRTGWKITWVEVNDWRKSTTLLTNHEVDMAIADSATIARLFSRQAKAKLIWIDEAIDDSEGLIVHNRYHASRGGEIRSPLDLRGKRIGVQFGSTAHYALASYYKEFGAKILYDGTYQRLHICNSQPFGKLVPCHFVNQTDAVVFFGMEPEELESAYYNGTIHAAYIGYPHLLRMRKFGTILMTNTDCGRWEKVTFRGLLASELFLERPNVTAFLKEYFITNARANFYWYNNTKEFTLYYPGMYSVSAKVSRVLPGVNDKEVYTLMSEMSYPSLKEQVSQQWMGGGTRSRIVYSLWDHSLLFQSLKTDLNVKPLTEISQKLSTQDVHDAALADVLPMEEYLKYIDPSYVNLILAENVTDAYHLKPEDIVHLGYQISDIHGPTISILTGDDCSLYPSPKYPTSILTPDIKALPKCRCREYYIYGKCKQDPGYSELGYYCLRRAAAAVSLEDRNPNCVGNVRL